MFNIIILFENNIINQTLLLNLNRYVFTISVANQPSVSRVPIIILYDVWVSVVKCYIMSTFPYGYYLLRI